MFKICASVLAGLCLLAADSLAPAAPPAAEPLSSGEVSALAERQAADLATTQWGRAIEKTARLRTIFPKAQPVSAVERDSLVAMENPALEDTVAAGAGSVFKRILWYIPDRFLDFVDMFSFRAALLGAGLIAEVHITRWVNLGLGAEVTVPPTVL